MYEFIGIGNQLSKQAVVGEDGVNLTDEGIKRLKTILKNHHLYVNTDACVPSELRKLQLNDNFRFLFSS